MNKKVDIEIKGKFCEVPHDDRIIELYDCSDSCDLTDIDVFIVIHECSCNLKNKMNKVMRYAEMKSFMKRCEKYFIGTPNLKSKLKEFSIKITGEYNELPNPNRKLVMSNDGTLTNGEIHMVLYDLLCVLRNQLSKTISRKDLSILAEKHNINGLGMRFDEDPFVTRGEEELNGTE